MEKFAIPNSWNRIKACFRERKFFGSKRKYSKVCFACFFFCFDTRASQLRTSQTDHLCEKKNLIKIFAFYAPLYFYILMLYEWLYMWMFISPPKKERNDFTMQKQSAIYYFRGCFYLVSRKIMYFFRVLFIPPHFKK